MCGSLSVDVRARREYGVTTTRPSAPTRSACAACAIVYAGARGADARDDRNVTTHRLDDGLDHSIAFVAREQRTLPVRPEREDRVDAAVDDEAGVVRGRFHVE
jgi:hypothetical protein